MHCLDNTPGEIEEPVKILVTRNRTERPHGALLQFNIGYLSSMYRIGRSLGRWDASLTGGAVGILPLLDGCSNSGL